MATSFRRSTTHDLGPTTDRFGHTNVGGIIVGPWRWNNPHQQHAGGVLSAYAIAPVGGSCPQMPATHMNQLGVRRTTNGLEETPRPSRSASPLA
jgi:hypothetical protein